MTKYLSRKWLLTLLTNAFALYLAFGGKLTGEQTAAVLAFVNSVYMLVNYYENKATNAPLESDDLEV